MAETGEGHPQGIETGINNSFDGRIIPDHIIIGSTVTVDGSGYGFKNFKKDIASIKEGDKSVIRKILTPIGLAQGNLTLDQARERRMSNGHPKKVNGMFSVFTYDQIGLDLEEGLNVSLEYGEVRDNGLVVPKWEIRLKDGKGEEVLDKKLIGRLKVRYKFKKVGFRIETIIEKINDNENTTRHFLTLDIPDV